MSSAGDVNGDGFDDIVGSVSNSSFVVFGKASGFDANIDLHSLLDGTNGFKLTGIVDGEGRGLGGVSRAGDFNHDGFDDLVIDGGSGSDNYLVYGKSTGFAAALALDKLDGKDGALLQGNVLQVNAAGDVNKDGFDDLILIGDNTAYVVFGSVLV